MHKISAARPASPHFRCYIRVERLLVPSVGYFAQVKIGLVGFHFPVDFGNKCAITRARSLHVERQRKRLKA